MSYYRSAEPGRKAPYSKDLRWRIVWQRTALELSYKEIGRHLNIAESTARRIYLLFQTTGDVSPKYCKQKPYLRRLDELFIIGVVLEKPAIYLGEMCQLIHQMSNIHVSQATICRLIHRYGITRKKIKQIALQRSASLRGYFMAQALLYTREQIVWLDETGSDTTTFMRQYGYAIRGQTPHCHRLLLRGKRISVMAAMSSEKIIAHEYFTGTLDSHRFFDFIRGTLIPQMHPFDGSSPMSILIMDNCSVHHVQEIKDLVESVGILLLYLPPYSPDLMPLEEVFSKVKSFIRANEHIFLTTSSVRLLVTMAFASVTQEDCTGYIRHSGYIL